MWRSGVSGSLSAVVSVSGESSGGELTQQSDIDQSVSVPSLSERPDRSDESEQRSSASSETLYLLTEETVEKVPCFTFKVWVRSVF